MKRFKEQELDPMDYRHVEIAANVIRSVLTKILGKMVFIIGCIKRMIGR